MKFIVTWKFKNKEEINTVCIRAKDLDEAEKIATEKFSSNKRDWLDIIYSDRSKANNEY